MVQSHEYNVNHNTESDEELCEGVKHNDWEHLKKNECYAGGLYSIVLIFSNIFMVLRKYLGDFYLRSSDPEPAAVPDAHHVWGPLDTVEHDVLHLGSLVVIIL